MGPNRSSVEARHRRIEYLVQDIIVRLLFGWLFWKLYVFVVPPEILQLPLRRRRSPIRFLIGPHLLYLGKPILGMECYGGHIHLSIIELLLPKLDVKPEIPVRVVLIKLSKTLEVG